MQVRMNLESKGHSVKITGITAAGEKSQDYPEVLFDALSHIPTRVGTACLNLNSLEGKPTAGECSRVRSLLFRITLTLMSSFLKSVILVSRPMASLDGGSLDNGVWLPLFELPI